MSVTVNTECACCAQPVEIEIDSELNYKVKGPEIGKSCEPVVFEPSVDLFKIEGDNIIDSF